jgi:thiol:disulfide interchange protein DsbC
MPGVWLVAVEKNNQKIPLYIDYSKNYVVTGNIIRLKDQKNVTNEQLAKTSRVDLSQVPLDDALLIGRSDARTKVIVFTDPQCPYCIKLHPELKQVVAADPNIAFLIKLYPLPMHPNAYAISKSIVCNRSTALLDAAFAGKPVPPPLCETRAIDENLALVAKLGIRSTPTLVLPDGMALPGYKTAADLLLLLGSDKSVPENTSPMAVKP